MISQLQKWEKQSSKHEPAILISQESASSRPPPSAEPSSAAIVGIGRSERSTVSCRILATNGPTSDSSIFSRSFRSAPTTLPQVLQTTLSRSWSAQLQNCQQITCHINSLSAHVSQLLSYLSLQTHASFHDRSKLFRSSLPSSTMLPWTFSLIPRTWNSLPETVPVSSSMHSFWNNLQTELSTQSFAVWPCLYLTMYVNSRGLTNYIYPSLYIWSNQNQHYS